MKPVMKVVCEDPASLSTHLPAWQSLADAAVEPNVFYEPWMLLPALTWLREGAELRIALVYRTVPGEPPLLCGLFPLERHARFRGLPVSSSCVWKYRHCFVCTPLIRAGYVQETLAALLDWLPTPLLEIPLVAVDGACHHDLVDLFNERRLDVYAWGCFTRAFLRPTSDAEAYLEQALSPHRRKQLRYKARKLADRGGLAYTALEAGGDVAGWCRAFLALEASGWKGRERSALASTDAGGHFFEAALTAAAQRDRLLTLALSVDGTPIAQHCCLRAANGAFAFKTAFDEGWSAYSPGVLLAVESVRRLHAIPSVRWIDSCAAWNSPLNRLWSERARFESMLVATGRWGAPALAAFPMLRWARRTLLRA
jgi:CelD/BcsL family acetyltransferase involved in cellulose biosynthesis